MKRAIVFLMVLFSINLVSAGVCSSLYSFILSNDFNYTDEEFMDLTIQLNISYENLTEYRYNYYDLCGKELPKQKLPKLIIYKNLTECNLTISSIFKYGIPLPTINLGNLSCGSVSKLKYFFGLEEYLNDYEIKKIRLFPLIIILLIIGILKFILLNSKLNKEIK